MATKIVNGREAAMSSEEAEAFEASRSMTLPQARRYMRDLIAQHRERAEQGGFTHSAVVYGSRGADLARLSIMAQRARTAKADSDKAWRARMMAADDSGHAGQRVLSFDRAVETAIYNTLPDNLESLLKRHPLKCPVSYIGGLHSVEMGRVGMALTEKVTRGRIMMLDGTHLFPMEKPLATAAAVEAALLSFAN